ncbi:MAG: hypothetical protein QG670_244 [Thermoproteota archaeon]|nr:hypothetical protein [Thermoproteota archaeon]
MIVSVHAGILSRLTSVPAEAVDIAAKAGIKYLELPVQLPEWKINPETVTQENITEVKETLGLRVKASSLGAIWPDKYPMVTTSSVEWKRNLDYANKLFNLAVTLDAKVMNLGGGQVRSVPTSMPYYDGVKLLAKFWKEASKQAENLGVIVAIEHFGRHETNVGDSTKQIIDLIKAVDSPSFQMNAQIFAMAYTDLDVPAAIKASRRMIKLVHIADVLGINPLTESISTVLPGRGKLDFKAIFRALKIIGYDGEICIEVGLGKDPASELAESRRFIEANWREA